ncbi:DUF3570 domain-containing protein [Sphaerotilaceae bacterium SBD11-9]
MAATKLWRPAVQVWRNLLRLLAHLRRHRSHTVRAAGLLGGAVGGALAGGAAHAAPNLPEDRADVMYHRYEADGLTADGPALLVRKKVNENLSLSGSYYVDMVSNASIDVVTTASPYKETRNEYGLGFDYIVRDATLSVNTSQSKEPDYIANTTSIDVAQEVFGGMTTISLGFTRGHDDVGRKGEGFIDNATHWRYRFGVTQILTPTWLMSANVEAVSDDGFLGSPYRAARAFGTTVPENNPRTRSSRAFKLQAIGEVTPGNAIRAGYRYFWDNWDIRAHTIDGGYSRQFGERWLVDWYGRYYTQSKALFYSDNATSDMNYISRNRQLSTYKTMSLGAKMAYTAKQVPGSYEVRLNAAYEYIQFKYSDFTDIRDGKPYEHNANVLQLFATVTF